MSTPAPTVVARAAALLVVLWSGSAAASGGASVADEAQFHFDRGNNAYRQGRFEDALDEYYSSNRLVANRNVQFNVARCLEQLGRYNEAFRAWSALDSQPGSVAERKSIAEAIERLRQHLALVRVESDPPGALIYVNRRDLGSLGQTPKTLALPPGDARVILDMDGFRSTETAVTTARGREVKIAPKLERIYGWLMLRHVPEEAMVRVDYVDGEVVQHGPGRLRMLPGRKVLFVSAPGFETERVETEIRPDDTTLLDVPMVAAPPATGALVVRANIDNSLVRVDGKEMGFTPTVIEGLLVGRHEIEISREGRQAAEHEVEIRKGERTYLEVTLSRAEREISAATKNMVRAEDAPASISVVTAEEIASMGYTTIAEALAGVRGAFASNDRIYESIGFRGFSPPGDYTNRVLVLVDGHPYNDITSGQGYVGHDFDVDLANVDRIEVVRGPGSILYGSAALFGVVNIVTKRPALGSHAGAEGQLSSLGGRLGRVTVSGRTKAVEAWASVAGLQAVGESRFLMDDASIFADPATAPAMTAPARNSDNERAKRADVGLRVGELTLRAAVSDRIKLIPTLAFGNLPGTEYHDTRAFAELRWEHSFGRWKLAARAAYDASRFRGTYKMENEPDLYDRFRAQWTTGELRLSLPQVAGHSFILGTEGQAQFDLDMGSPSDLSANGVGTQYIASAYLVDDWIITKRLRANVGVRADRYGNQFGTTVNPRVAIIGRPYAAGNTKLLFGRAFRAPSIYERYYSDGVTQFGSDNLAPETVLSVELEHSHRIDDDTTLVATVFGNQLTNMLVLQARGVDENTYAFANSAGKVLGVGAETELRWEPGGGDLVVFAYGWQRVEQDTGDQGWQPFVNAPSHFASLRVLHPLASRFLRLGTEVLYDVGRHTREGIQVDDAMIANVTLSGEYRAWRLRYFAGIFNLFDVRGARTGFPVGEENLFVTIPRYGRSARMGLSFTF